MFDPTDTQKASLRITLANLIGESDRIPEMGSYRMRPHHIPPALKFERALLEAMYSLRGDKRPPTAKALLTILDGDARLKDIDVKREFDVLLGMREPHGEVYTGAKAWKHWTATWELSQGLHDIADKVERFASIEDARHQINELVSKIKVFDDNSDTIDYDNAWKETDTEMKDYEVQVKAGEETLFSMPFRKLNEIINPIEPGEMMTIAAKSGYGKSTVAFFLARWFAWHVRGLDVAFYHVETRRQTYIRRDWARKFLIPMKTLKTLRMPNSEEYFNLHRGPWAPKAEAYRQYIIKAERENGRIMWQHRPRSNTSNLEQAIDFAKGKADAAGRKLVVILDYLNKIHLPHYTRGVELNEVAEMVKHLAEQYSVYVVTFVQDDFNVNYEHETNRRMSFGGQGVIHNSQIFIRIHRSENAKQDAIVRSTRNAFGEPIYYHRAGELDSEMRWDVLKANDGPGGNQFTTRMIGAYFDIVGPGGFRLDEHLPLETTSQPAQNSQPQKIPSKNRE